MDTLNFKAIFLGQSVIKYKVPLDIFHSINTNTVAKTLIM